MLFICSVMKYVYKYFIKKYINKILLHNFAQLQKCNIEIYNNDYISLFFSEKSYIISNNGMFE